VISQAVIEHTESGWLALQRAGHKPAEIARTLRIRPSKVYAGISAARLREARNGSAALVPRPPRLVPYFGPSCKPMALLTCADVHPRGPMPKGSSGICMAKHCTGIEGHPALYRDPATDPKPDPKPSAAKAKAKPTRRQKRRRSA
jgi:hypothetical protein